MKTLAIALAASLIGSAALAQTTTITKEEDVLGSKTTIKQESGPTVIQGRPVDTTGTVGCETRSVTKTNEFGDSKTKTKTEC